MRRIAIICGKGELAQMCIDTCSAKGELSCVIAVNGDYPIKDPPYPFTSVCLGQVGMALDFIKLHNANHVIFIGGIRRPSISELKLDSIGKRWLVKLGTIMFSGDDKLLRGLSKLFEKEGLKVIGVDDILNDMTSDYIQTKLVPDSLALSDIKRGMTVAKALGSVDVGQSVIVQQGIVLGVEAIEGTDALIDRCANLRLDGAGGVLIKVMKPNQDKRMDMPVIGVKTVKKASAAGLRGIAIEKGRVLVSFKEKVVNTADEFGLFITAMEI